jgi:twitching motility protein PilT
VLVTGPTGSGKSTTLAALLDHIARKQGRHLITLEDPIEYVFNAGPTSVVNQREHGASFTSFPDALRQALRQDPDVVLVGEMRDAATAQTAVTAAETGHLVFSTLHTYDAQSTVARLVSMYPEGEQDHAREKLAYILRGVVSQTLVPRANTTGRVAAMEIMTSTPAIANNLRNPQGIVHLRSTIQTSRKEGMQTMEMALADLVVRGVVSQEEAEFRARDIEEFRRYLTKMDW